MICFFCKLRGSIGRNSLWSDDNSTGMNPQLSQISLEIRCQVKGIFYLFVCGDIIVYFLVFFCIWDNFFEWAFFWDNIRNLIRHLKRNSNRPCRVFECRFGCHFHKGSYCTYLFLTIFFCTIVNHSLSLGILKINIKIGHRNSRRIEESFKEKVKWKRINIGDLNRPS